MTQPTMTQDRLDMPEGYTARPWNWDDAEAIADLFNHSSQHMGYVEDKTEAEQLRKWYDRPKFSLDESTLLVQDTSGLIVGAISVWDTSDTPVAVWVPFSIDPDHADSGIGEAMLRWGEARARQAIAKCPPNSRVVMHTESKSDYPTKQDIIHNFGMTEIRHTFRMRIDMTEAPPSPQFADGYSIRTYNHPDELDALIQADIEGFRDHFGFVEPKDEENHREQWVHWIQSIKEFDPTLWFLVIDDATGDIAGLCLALKEAYRDPTIAYIDAVAVLPNHRRQGIALAMLHHAFGEFYRRGQNHVTLHVDAESITGAVRLYERAGMHVDRHSTTYEKELREGEDLMRS